MRNIRMCVFETNSSSVHSLVISNKDREQSKLKLNKEGKIEIDFGSFGKEHREYTSQYDKLSYLITCLYYIAGYDIENIYNQWEFDNIEKVVCSYTGATGIEILGKVEPFIDHQSIPDNTIDIINTYDSDMVINFIFNKSVSLKTSCD